MITSCFKGKEFGNLVLQPKCNKFRINSTMIQRPLEEVADTIFKQIWLTIQKIVKIDQLYLEYNILKTEASIAIIQ